ncbi:Rieske 2Fe-2S domain-containing protein, partial [Streptomyces sp. V4-01]|nr:Rieske 2Fe-2S domain-containing protein [Streptomyces sp. V4-01]
MTDGLVSPADVGNGLDDLRTVGPDFWYPVAASGSVRRNTAVAASFAGERIALYRTASGRICALEDRCAHLLDMNHQFLHRGVLGRIQPELLGHRTGPSFVEASYRFTSGGGRKDRGAGLLSRE